MRTYSNPFYHKATVGMGGIIVGGVEVDPNLNRDIDAMNVVTRDEQTKNINGSATIDMRFFSAAGRASIKHDFRVDAVFGSTIGTTLYDGLLNSTDGFAAKFTLTKLYTQLLFNSVLQNNPELAKEFQDSASLSPEKRDEVYQKVYKAVNDADLFGLLGMSDGAVKSAGTDTLNKGNPGVYDKSKGDVYLLADAGQNATLGGLLEVYGHEAFAHGVGVSDEAYAKYVGGSFAGWIDDSLWVNDQGSLNRQADVNWGKNDPLSLNYLNSNTARLSQVSPINRDNFYGALGSLLVPLGAAALTYLGLSESTQAVIKQVDIQKVLANCTGSVCEDDATGMSIPKDTLEALLRDAVFDEVNGRLLSISGIAIDAIVPGKIPTVNGKEVITSGGMTGFKGSSGFELKNAPSQPLRNEATTINGRDYSGHALDQIQNRGLMPSVVENTIQYGTPIPAKPGASAFYDRTNNVTVSTDSQTGKVITTGFGEWK